LDLTSRKHFTGQAAAFLEAFHAAAGICVHLGHTPCCWDATPAYPIFLDDQQLSAYICEIIQHMAECFQPSLEGLILAEGSYLPQGLL